MKDSDIALILPDTHAVFMELDEIYKMLLQLKKINGNLFS